MAYSGDELDLRTLQSWAPTEPLGSPLSAGGARDTRIARGEPLWVDDLVLACCNDAYDLAAANRAGEVRLEHLLNAMTRVEGAAKALEQMGARVSGLRRETGQIVVSEIPIAYPNGKGQPKTSVELDTVLRRAADMAYARRRPVTIEDLIATIADGQNDYAGSILLRRFVPAPRLEEPRERIRTQARSATYFGELPRSLEPAPAVVSDDASALRIEALERSVRELAQSLGAERRSLASLIGDVRQDLSSRTADTSGRFSEFAKLLDDRLDAMRREPGRGDGASLDAIQRLVKPLSERLSAIESKLATQPDSAATLSERMTQLERSVQAGLGEGARNWASLGARLESFDRATAAPAAALAKLDERLETFGRSLAETGSAGALVKFGERLDSIERLLGQQKQIDLQPVAALGDRVAGLEQGLATALDTLRRSTADIADRVETFEAALDGQQSTLSEVITQARESEPRIQSLLQTGVQSGIDAVKPLSERIAGLQDGLAGSERRARDFEGKQERDLIELHDALVKLSTNQELLAAHLEQWRHDTTGDLSIISNRLRVLEENSARKLQILDHVTGGIAIIQERAAKREARRTWFNTWLYGTTDVWGAWRGNRQSPPPLKPSSNPSQLR